MAWERFRFVPMGESAPAGAISCDGLVPGAELHLSHWEGNLTPEAVKADTSTEIAANFVKSVEAAAWRDAPIVNNHFDTDGVLSCWTLLRPEEALRRRGLLLSSAEAGDFSEWPRDPRGIMVDAAITRLGAEAGDEAAAYDLLFEALPELLDRIEDRRELWGDTWHEIEMAMELVNQGIVEVSQFATIGVIRHPAGIDELPGPVIARMLGPKSWRYLLAFATPDGTFDYRYERPRYAWATTVQRRPLEAPDAETLARALGPSWTPCEHTPGGTGIVRTASPVPDPPEQLLRRLSEHDDIVQVR